MPNKYSKDFGTKEMVLNYANGKWGLTKTHKVGEVMALIRECQPKTFEEWEQWYFEHAHTKTKVPHKVTKESLRELGERLHTKIIEFLIPKWQEAFRTLTLDDCIDFIYNLTINRTYDGYVTEKSVVTDGLSKKFPSIKFEESSPQLDHAGDIDYLGWVGDKAFGIQIKPVTARANFGGYSLTERMKASFEEFTQTYGGKVFIVFSLDGEIGNPEVLDQINNEIERLERS